MRLTYKLSFAVIALCGGCATAVRTELMKPISATCVPDRQLGGEGKRCLPGRGFRTVTFNTALAPGIHTDVREKLKETVAQIDREVDRSDLVCLQEVWTQESREAIRQSVLGKGVQVLEYDSRGMGESGRDRCSMGELNGVMGCVREKCSQEAPEDVTICARNKCYWKLVWLYLSSRPCLNCLIASIGKDSEEIVRTCVNGPGASRAYGGDNGVMLISRRPMRRIEAGLLPASGSNRVALFAGIEVAPGREIEVACTHISSNFSSKPTDVRFRTWEEEQAAQVNLIIRRLKQRADGRPQLFMGDFNLGQKHDPGVNQVMWATWKILSGGGFVSPAEYAEPPLCSYCRGNLMNGAKSSVLIDHVFAHAGSGHLNWDLRSICAERTFDQPITFVNRKGQAVRTHLSDHYGIAVEFELLGQ